jgi:hypothetical protein
LGGELGRLDVPVGEQVIEVPPDARGGEPQHLAEVGGGRRASLQQHAYDPLTRRRVDTGVGLLELHNTIVPLIAACHKRSPRKVPRLAPRLQQ